MKSIFEAIRAGEVSAVSSLLHAGADLNGVEGQTGWRPLHVAVDAIDEGGPDELVDLLIDHGAEVSAWDRAHEVTPLLMAVFRGLHRAAERLLRAGADVHAVSGEGESPLRWAASHGDYAMAKLLIEHGAAASIDASGGPGGRTALGEAAVRLDEEMVKLVLKAGANPRAVDVDGFTAVERAQRQWERVRSLLTRNPGSVEE
jgi:ankyrin repeat protein